MSKHSIARYGHYIWSNKNYRLSTYIAAISLLWLGSGIFAADPVVGSDVAKSSPKTMSVKARYVDAQPYQPKLQIRAHTEANRQLRLRSELSGKVVALPVAEGAQVTAGEVICELATEDRALRLVEARSAVDQAQLEYNGAVRLKSGGYQSRTAIAAAKARLDSAKANYLRRELDLENTKIRAPFAGVLDHYSVELGDYMDRGAECGQLLDLNPMVASGRVSETEVGSLSRGNPAIARLLTGEQVEGQISLVGYGSDEVTRTFLVEVELDNPDLTLRSGITTDLEVPLASRSAHVIPSSLLSLDDAGKVGVRILNEQHQVQFLNVELIGDHRAGIWVSGLPQRALVITVGQEYVSPGEQVAATIEGGVPASTLSADATPAKTASGSLEDQTVTAVGADKL